MTGVLPYVPREALHLLPRDVVAFEPRSALDGGQGGLGLVTRVVERSSHWVAPGGWLLIEVGGEQFDDVDRLFRRSGYRDIQVLEDGDGDPRAVSGRLTGPTFDHARGYASSR
jgi:release factor glutamine methyltransferase